MIIVTGGAGFIGSAFVWRLNQTGFDDILVVDNLGSDEKWKNLAKRKINDIVSIESFHSQLSNQTLGKVSAIIHLGACSSTTENNADYLLENNTHYSAQLFNYCADKKIPFIYASSAATYGDGEVGYSDDHKDITFLKPINKYAYSKHLFDRWALRQTKSPPFWAGLKFFNVYGPNEYHKGGQASVVLHAFPQVRDHGQLKLFKSYVKDISHGEQSRDFIYVKDVVEMIDHVLNSQVFEKSGLYNIGTGIARTFVDLGKSVFSSLDAGPPKFEWIEMPEALKKQYQYFTQAEMQKFRTAFNYEKPLTDLELGIDDYLRNYLLRNDLYL